MCQEAPWARSSATLSASTGFRGRPIRAPRARAAAMPDPHTLADQLPLEFGHAGEDAEHQPSVRCRSIHALVDRNKLNPERVELTERVHKLASDALAASLVLAPKKCEEPATGREQT